MEKEIIVDDSASYYLEQLSFNNFQSAIDYENILEKKRFSDWYKNDLQFETAVLKWKEHLK